MRIRICYFQSGRITELELCVLLYSVIFYPLLLIYAWLLSFVYVYIKIYLLRCFALFVYKLEGCTLMLLAGYGSCVRTHGGAA